MGRARKKRRPTPKPRAKKRVVRRDSRGRFASKPKPRKRAKVKPSAHSKRGKRPATSRRGRRPKTPVPKVVERSEGPDLDDDELDEYAELWGVGPEDVEALAEELDMSPDEMTKDELREYIDSLYDALVDEGWELDVSDLWDMYYGYAPGSGGKAA